MWLAETGDAGKGSMIGELGLLALKEEGLHGIR